MIATRARPNVMSAAPAHAPPVSLSRGLCGVGRRATATRDGSCQVRLSPCSSVGQQLMPHSIETLQWRNVDLTRQFPALARGSSTPQIIRANGRTAEQLAEEIRRLLPSQHTVLAARVTAAVAGQLQVLFPDALYHPQAQILTVRSELSSNKPEKQPGTVGIVCGSPAEGVAEECRMVAAHIGCYTFKVNLSNMEALRSADVVIVVSDLDGALPPAIAGLVESPVIAIPTSDEHGDTTSLTPLLSASFSSSSPISFVNVNDGVSAASMAMRILLRVSKVRSAARSSLSSEHSAVGDGSNSTQPPSAQDVSTFGPRCAWPAKKKVFQ